MAELTAQRLRDVARFLDSLNARHVDGVYLGGQAPDVYVDDQVVGTLQRAYPEGTKDPGDDWTDETVWTYCIRTEL